MSAILDADGRLFRPYPYEKEQDFEASVVRLADQIFGSSTIYVNVKKKVGNDIVTIPDGYVVDMTQPDLPKLFIVENEIVSHDPFKHIGIQMLKFATSFDEARGPIRKFLMHEITGTKGHLTRLEQGTKQSTSRNVDAYLERAVDGEFKGVVVIDEARPELHRVLEKINANVSVLELKTFVSDNGQRIHQFDTLYDEDEELPQESPVDRAGMSAAERAARRARRALSDTIIVPAREEGFKRVFLGENQWYAIRIGAAMKDRIKYIAAYQVQPVGAVTHIAEVKEIRPYQDTGKYLVLFKDPAETLPRKILVKESKNSPQGPIYVQRAKLMGASVLEDALDETAN